MCSHIGSGMLLKIPSFLSVPLEESSIMTFKHVATSSSPVLSRKQSSCHPARRSDLVLKTVSSRQPTNRQNTTQIFLNPNPSLPVKLRIYLTALWLGYGLHDRGFEFRSGRNFSLLQNFQVPLSLLFNDTARLSQGKAAGAQSSPYTPPGRAEVKLEWTDTSTPPVYLHCVHKDFIFWHLIRLGKTGKNYFNNEGITIRLSQPNLLLGY